MVMLAAATTALDDNPLLSWHMHYTPYALTFIVAITVYTKTLMPSIPGGDSGELVAESCELGTAHPPGYPLYTLVVHLLTYVPVGTMAWRANEFCAILGALAAANIAQCVYALTSNEFSMIPKLFQHTGLLQRQAASLSAGLLYAFSPLVWTYSVGSEVFAMNNFFSSLLIVLTIRFAAQTTTNGRHSAAILGSFVCGLGMCNQHTQILFQIPLIIFVFWSLRATMTMKHIFFLATAFLIGLAPYIYLPIGSIYFPKRGAWGDMSSWIGFFRHLRRADYGTFKLYSRDDDTQGLTERLIAHAWDYTSRQSLWIVGPIFSTIGIVCSLSTIQCLGCQKKNGGIAYTKVSSNKSKKTKQSTKQTEKNATVPTSDVEVVPQTEPVKPVEPVQVGVALICFFIFYEIGFHSLSNLPLDNKLLFGIHARFWMQPNILLFMWLGIGLAWCLTRLQLITAMSSSSDATFWGTILFWDNKILLCATFFVFQLSNFQLLRWYVTMDQSENRYLEQYARGILESLPPKSLYFTNYDQQWTASRYLHVCEHVRRDIPFINLSMMTFWWFHRQRELFPEIQFPKRCTNPACGAYLGGDHTAQYKRGEAFTFKELLDANIDRFPGGELIVFFLSFLFF